jgi:glyoxylase-like metal-dependent hydrolase (beta-lactamase superfamily II)
MTSQIPLGRDARAEETEEGRTRVIATDLAYQRLGIVNVAYIGMPGEGGDRWALVDCGVTGTTRLILAAVEERFGRDSRPCCIVMTHGHFDHVGGLTELADRWEVPVYAHPLEVPYLNGKASYPPPDPTVGGGLMSTLSPLYPRGPIDVSRWLRAVPGDGVIPELQGWRWVQTPGHTPGHISLWRDSDRSLIAGDAFITTRQESVYAAAVQSPELHGPPMYYTQDWEAARESVRQLATLEPELVITGHGRAMQGERLREALHTLARDFDEIAVPEHGRYVRDPARPGGPNEAYPDADRT